ncbi:4058_t:CDS:2 [Acaulospora colombiana]|uniref:4058_t:CDS:1 n=1 Tax=Acaulospora colombiana TaxID=27376 RepID=A0ACA9MSK0_9GLOM|nr:4058_t:CDS:2 [Acaulospora colombiana]
MTDESSASSSDHNVLEDENKDISGTFQLEYSELERNEEVFSQEGSDNKNIELFQQEKIAFYPYKEFEQIEKIGDGSCGDIFKATLKNTQRIVTIRPAPLSDEFKLQDLINEIKQHEKLEYNYNILRFHGISTQECWQQNDIKRPTAEQVHTALSEIDIDDVLSNYEILCSFDDISKEESSSKAKEIDGVEIPTSDINAESSESHRSANGIDNAELSEDADSTSQFDTDIQIDLPPVETFSEIDQYIKGLFQFYIDQFNMQHHSGQVALKVRKYMEGDKKNPTKVFAQVLQHPNFSYFTSLVGFFYRHGIGTLVDYEMAFEMYSMATNEMEYDILEESDDLLLFDRCKRENTIIGRISLGLLYYNGLGLKKDEKKAFQIFMDAAEDGSSWAQSCVGHCYYSGRGVDERDESKAFEWNFKSAKNGSLVGQCNLGYYYQGGIGTEFNEQEGFQLYLQAAEAGNIEAAYVAGYCYEVGKGVGKDERKTFEWYLKLGEQGYDIAQCDVGYCYYNGIGVAKDEEKAFEWYLKSAENDYSFGQLQVGKCYKNGYGTQKDILKMFHWLTKARDNGEQDAEDILQDIIDRMV